MAIAAAVVTVACGRWRRLVTIATTVIAVASGRWVGAAAWRSGRRRAVRTWCWHWVWIGHRRAFVSLATTGLRNSNRRRRLSANSAHFLSDSEALRNMAWPGSPGRMVTSTALRDSVCCWHSPCRTKRHIRCRVDGGVSRASHVALGAVRDGGAFRDCDHCLHRHTRAVIDCHRHVRDRLLSIGACCCHCRRGSNCGLHREGVVLEIL